MATSSWQIPPNTREFPLLMVHASSLKTWETTFDGEEGFRDIFLRWQLVHLDYRPAADRPGGPGLCGATSYEPELDSDQESLQHLAARLSGFPARRARRSTRA